MRTDELAFYEALGQLVGKAVVVALIVMAIVAIGRRNARVAKAAQSAPPAAWYADPEQPGYVRYWDGTQWTEHREPAPPT